jgi:hypothetical protein
MIDPMILRRPGFHPSDSKTSFDQPAMPRDNRREMASVGADRSLHNEDRK